MSVTLNIARTYRQPRKVVTTMMRHGISEAQVLAYLMLACVLIFVAQWPVLSRAAMLDPEVTFQQRMGGALFGVMFMLPLVLYGLAGFIQLFIRLFSTGVPGLWVRLGVFWAFLAVTPLMLLQGGLLAFLGPSDAVRLFGFVVAAVFLYILWTGLAGAVQLARQRTS